MKKCIGLVLTLIIAGSAFSQLQLKAPGVKWEETYSFDKCNVFKMEAFAKNHELMRTRQYKTWYQSGGENFMIQMVTEGKGNGMETIIDKKNEVAIQMMGSGGGAVPYYNAGGYKYPAEADLKRLDIVATGETKIISGYNCRKYTYSYKKIFGEVWITEELTLPNDAGVFRACKMAALHNTLSVPGFVMEMTTEDANGGKTLMTTLSIGTEGKFSVDLKSVDMNTAINKVNYYTF